MAHNTFDKNHPDHPPVEGGYTGLRGPNTMRLVAVHVTTRKGDLELGSFYRAPYDYTRTQMIDGLNSLLKHLNLRVVDHDYSF